VVLIISVRENPEYMDTAIKYFQSKWANEESLMVYEDCIENSMRTASPLPQWYLLCDHERIIGCAGLITNDFISRMDLYPWVCALYIEEDYRGNHYGAILLDKAEKDARDAGFLYLYLCTELIGFYEQYGFNYIGIGYHPWGESSRIYSKKIQSI